MCIVFGQSRYFSPRDYLLHTVVVDDVVVAVVAVVNTTGQSTKYLAKVNFKYAEKVFEMM